MQSSAPPSNLNIANVLTVLRIAGVPVFGWLLLIDSGQSEGWRWAAWFAFGLLMFTDKLDGDLARSRNLITNFGKIADPIADKALTGMAFIGLSIIGVLWWWVTIVMLVREWGITIMRMFLVRRGVVMPAGSSGKLKTVLQAFAIGGYLIPLELWDHPAATVASWFVHALMAAALIVALVSAVQYVLQARQAIAAGATSV